MDEKLDSDEAPASMCQGRGAEDARGAARQTSADPAALSFVSTPLAQSVCTSETETSETPTPVLTTTEQAISTGDPGKVSALIKSTDEPSAVVRLLTGCYGGQRRLRRESDRRDLRNDPDENGLFPMTTPVLHAAYTGNTSMFSTVYGAIQDNLRARPAKTTMLSTDVRGRSVLAMAVASKSKGMLETVLAALEDHLATDEVKKILLRYKSGRYCHGTILDCAAASGCRGMFEATMAALESRLTQQEIKTVMTYASSYRGVTIMASAAASGNKETWDIVLAQMETALGSGEVERMMMANVGMDGFPQHGTIVLAAIRGGSIAVLEAVLADLQRYLTPDQRNLMLLDANFDTPTVLQAAAEGGIMGMFEAVHRSLLEGPGPDEVMKLVRFSKVFGRNILHFAASCGKPEMFEAVMDIVEETEVKAMLVPWLSAKDDRRAVSAVSVLHVAANSGSEDMFEAVLSALNTRLTPDEVTKTIQSWTDPRLPEGYAGLRDVLQYCSVLHSAILSGVEAVVEAVWATLGSEKVKAMIQSTGLDCQTILHSAAMSGNKDIFEAALGLEFGGLSPLEVKDMLISEVKRSGLRLGAAAVSSGNLELVQAVVREMDAVLLLKEEATALIDAAAGLGCVTMWETATEAVTNLYGESLAELFLQHPSLGLTAIGSKDPATVKAVFTFVRRLFGAEEASEAFSEFVSAGFSAWTSVVRDKRYSAGRELGWAIEVLSCILEYPAVLDPTDMAHLSRHTQEEWMGTCFLETLASVDNPFMAGMALSIALAKATDLVPQGERRKLRSVQSMLDNLLLEVLERLPQTVQGFGKTRGGIEACSTLFEPQSIHEGTRVRLGPLGMILQSRGHLETFATQPLVVDFLLRRFTNGLPDLLDTKNIFGDYEAAKYLVEVEVVYSPGVDHSLGSEFERAMEKEDEIALSRCLAIDEEDELWGEYMLAKGNILDNLRSPSAMLQGVSGRYRAVTSLSLLPAVQFLAGGLVAVPDAYYRVPAMRMALDFVLYLGMLAAFSAVILRHDDGPLSAGEIVFALFLLGGVAAEIQEMTRDVSLYVADHWNPIDILGLGLAAGGVLVRLVERTSSWGWALYALSSPFLFSRVLFFAQVLRFQGPMIQVIFGMVGELVKFGVVIVVVMLGFAMSFHALFHDVETFGQTILMLFQGMLGEVGFFEDFMTDEYGEYEFVATALFVIYLVVIAIMLLNLLIAVLSTSHSKVQEKADQEFMVSRARVIDHYWLVVKNHLLPPPFNLVQIVLSLPLSLAERSWRGPRITRVHEAVGRFVFWVTMGAIAVVGGTILWVVSAVFAPFAWQRHFDSRPRNAKLSHGSVGLRYVLVVWWCIVGAPLYLLAFWLTAPLRWFGLRPWSWVWGRRGMSSCRWSRLRFCSRVDHMLKYARDGLSVGKLQDFLEDPMSDPKVREDEKSRPTTVEHIKQLRDRLEKTNETHYAGAGESVQKVIEKELAKVELAVATSQENMDRKIDALVEVVQRAFVNRVGE